MNRLSSLLSKLIPGITQLVIVLGFLGVAIIFYNLGAGATNARDSTGIETNATSVDPGSLPNATHPLDTNGDGRIYTCSMHPQIMQDEPGSCPICGMELVEISVSNSGAPMTTDHSLHALQAGPTVTGYACAMNCVPPLEEPGQCPVCGMEMQPVYEEGFTQPGDSGESTRRLMMSKAAMALASIETSPVHVSVARRTVRLVGELVVSEDTLAHISADVGGRIDRLSAKYEGDKVEPGQGLVLLYSPELLAVQQEFLQALAASERLPTNALDSVRRAAASAVEGARERLRLAGLSLDQIESIEASGEAREQVEMRAPIGGTVIERHVQEGQYVRKGERILTIASLDRLWAEMAAYESDLPWLRVGQPVEFTSEAFPGDKFAGEVAWIDPVTRSRTRTTRVRLNVENEHGMLRPGMYLTARVHSTLGEAEQLIVPIAAPLVTGERAIVYVEVPDSQQPMYQGVEIDLGPRTDSGYIVKSGLKEGQRVVTNGAFRIDSALQIVAKPSMMNPDGGVPSNGHEGHGMSAAPEAYIDSDQSLSSGSAEQVTHTDHFRSTMEDISTEDLVSGYLEIQLALSSDETEQARHAWDSLRARSMHLGVSMPEARSLSMDALRLAFKALSDQVISHVRASQSPTSESLILVHCPMAFDFEGADWLQQDADVRNPYFGAEMLTCGSVVQDWSNHD